MGYINRKTNELLFPEIFEAIMKHVDGTPAKIASDADFTDKATMDARLEMYIKTVMNHVYSNEYGKCVYAWDVVNEYPHADNTNWKAVYGECGNRPEFVKKAYEFAHEVLESYDLFMSINSLKKSGANISGITWWGLSDETTWISGQQPLLFSKPGVKKLAYGN